MFFLKRIYEYLTHSIGNLTGKYYFEDFMRVYPDGIAYNRLGFKRSVTKADRNNFLNHRKFYRFAAQFAEGKRVIDIGCGSGHGSEVFRNARAESYCGVDLSKKSIRFARERYGSFGEFRIAGALDTGLPSHAFDIAVSNEVLEHVKEYGKEAEAIGELKRVAKTNGLIIVGTPNNELLEDHGFSFTEMDRLFSRFFQEYCIFENALVLPGKSKQLWEERKKSGQTGIVVSENIVLNETVLPEEVIPEIKEGIDPGIFSMGDLRIDTTLLHNTHSWIAIARNC